MLDELNADHSLDQSLVFSKHASGLVIGEIATPHCRGSFFLHGAHVASFRPRGQTMDVLFVSSEAVYAPGKAIRGGVPICFPWFSAHPSDPQAPMHGVVRTAEWKVRATERSGDAVVVTLEHFVKPFSMRYEMRFSNDLSLKFSVVNTAAQTKTCELALHTYLRLRDATSARVTGLESCRYLNQLTRVEHPPQDGPIVFTSETDRIYFGDVDAITVSDPASGREISIRPSNSRSTVVWNPWIEKSSRLTDFGDTEYREMCCVETARITPDAFSIPAGGEETVGVMISAC